MSYDGDFRFQVLRKTLLAALAWAALLLVGTDNLLTYLALSHPTVQFSVTEANPAAAFWMWLAGLVPYLVTNLAVFVLVIGGLYWYSRHGRVAWARTGCTLFLAWVTLTRLFATINNAIGYWIITQGG